MENTTPVTATANMHIFRLLVDYYQEVQGMIASLENILLSYETSSQEENTTKETIARIIWDRDYITRRPRNDLAHKIRSNGDKKLE